MTRKSDRFTRRGWRNFAKANRAKVADRKKETRRLMFRAAIRIGKGLWRIVMLPLAPKKRRRSRVTATMTIEEGWQRRQHRNAGIE